MAKRGSLEIVWVQCCFLRRYVKVFLEDNHMNVALYVLCRVTFSEMHAVGYGQWLSRRRAVYIVTRLTRHRESSRHSSA
jgi:hypothetical protein